jgi:hypothetical protein
MVLQLENVEYQIKDAANSCDALNRASPLSVIAAFDSVRSFAVEYKRHIVHLLRREVRMIEVNLTDVHVTCTCVGVSCFRRKEKLLRYYPDKQNCEHSDDVMLAHGIPPSFTMVLYTLESTTM